MLLEIFNWELNADFMGVLQAGTKSTALLIQKKLKRVELNAVLSGYQALRVEWYFWRRVYCINESVNFHKLY